MKRIHLYLSRVIGLGFASAVTAIAYADSLPICDEVMRRPKSVALEPIPPLKYPAEAYEAGVEGNFVYQYTLDVEGVVVPRCVVNGTGSKELDEAMLKRLSGARAILPRDYNFVRDRDTVYQDSFVASYRREFRSRQFSRSIEGSAEKFERLKPLYAPTPGYPREALDKGQEGEVTVIGLFDGAGRVTEVRIVKSSGFPLLDGEAMSAMSFVQLPASGTPKRVQRTFTFKVR